MLEVISCHINTDVNKFELGLMGNLGSNLTPGLAIIFI